MASLLLKSGTCRWSSHIRWKNDSVEMNTPPTSESPICHVKSPVTHWCNLKKWTISRTPRVIVSVSELFLFSTPLQPFLRNNELLQQVVHALPHFACWVPAVSHAIKMGVQRMPGCYCVLGKRAPLILHQTCGLALEAMKVQLQMFHCVPCFCFKWFIGMLHLTAFTVYQHTANVLRSFNWLQPWLHNEEYTFIRACGKVS